MMGFSRWVAAKVITLPAWLAVDRRRVHSNNGRAVGTHVVLVGAELSTFRGDLLLRRCVSISNLHLQCLVTNGLAIVLLDDEVTDLARFEANHEKGESADIRGIANRGLPSKTDSTTVAQSITENLARQDDKVMEDGTKLLQEVG